jgi:tyrosine-protein kinase Etk/Wzc
MSAVVNKGPAFNAAPDVDEEELNLGDLIGVVIENRWLIICITLAALLVGAYKAFTAVPIYRADGLLQVEEKKSGLANLDVATMMDDYTPVNAEIEINSTLAPGRNTCHTLVQRSRAGPLPTNDR